MAHTAVYGNTRIPRGKCPGCGDTSLIVDGDHQCCGHQAEGGVHGVKRLCEPAQKRRRLNKAEKKSILDEQDGSCFYCGRELGTYVFKGGRSRLLKLTWDHVTPYAYGQDNRTTNFVAACRVCNGWKSSRVFADMDEAKAYLARRWSSSGWA